MAAPSKLDLLIHLCLLWIVSVGQSLDGTLDRMSDQVTRLMAQVRAGDRDAFNVVMGLVYDELHQLAHYQLQHERANHTLNTTALVHEVYLKLSAQAAQAWQDRVHFLAIAARAMRQVLVDYARSRRRVKRGGDQRSVTLTLSHIRGEAAALSLDALLDLDGALTKLAALNERYVQVIECRYFAGLSIPETAQALSISHMTVSRDWRLARAWLHRELHA